MVKRCVGFLIKNIVSQNYLVSFEKPEFWRNDVKSGDKKDALSFDTYTDAKEFLKTLERQNIWSFFVVEE